MHSTCQCVELNELEISPSTCNEKSLLHIILVDVVEYWLCLVLL